MHLFDQAVSDRLRTNRLATYLSGGMDSTSVAATAHKLLSQTGRPFTFQAYSIDYEVKADPELAQKAAQFMGNETELISAKEYMLRAPDEEPSYLTPEPTYILNLLSEVELLRRASAKSHIIFTGHGGDPSFMHSPYYWRDLLKRGEIGLLVKNMYWHIQLHHQMPPLYLSQTLPIPQTLRNLRRRIRAHTNPSEVQQTFTFPAFLKTDLIRSFNLQDRYQEFWLKASIGGYQQGMATSPFWSNMFAWSDPGFNGIPLKHRYPFFDLRLLRFILAVPRIPWCINKALLRTAMKGRLPEAVLHQPKMYAASLSELMPYRKAPSWMRSLAHESALEPYIENPRLIKMVQELRQITGEGYRQISRVFSLAYWLRHWRPPKPADVPETFLYHTATSKYQ
ncbi:MAG TPA: asparagine synthase C-terminal domain-containing protein [Blastocatellia bacterium]|nr:asparagine synthase C-terminal domain-containing protein [Blastocatellia bacterium]